MPCPSRAHSCPPKLPPWEPAVTQLRDLSPTDLDALVTQWLTSQHCVSVRRCARQSRQTTYQALLGAPPLSIPTYIRVYQRQNRLQAHHVEAFLGCLVRTGVPAGILVTTGGASREAVVAAHSCQAPRIRLIIGAEWATELTGHQPGVKRRSLWAWILQLPAQRAQPASCRRPRRPR